MNSDGPISRRTFLSRAASASAAAAILPQIPLPTADERPRFPVIGFTKPFQTIGFEETADLVAEVGWTGIECPVRAKGQIAPENVEDELPKLRDALNNKGRALTLLATDIKGVSSLSERVLRTAAKLGITR